MTNRFLSPSDVRARVENKGTKFATVTFQKKDGSIRTKNGLFKPLSHIKGTGRKTPDGYIAIWSPNEDDPRDETKGKWGCFSLDKVIDIK
jgi:hypothetical protein